MGVRMEMHRTPVLNSTDVYFFEIRGEKYYEIIVARVVENWNATTSPNKFQFYYSEALKLCIDFSMRSNLLEVRHIAPLFVSLSNN